MDQRLERFRLLADGQGENRFIADTVAGIAGKNVFQDDHATRPAACTQPEGGFFADLVGLCGACELLEDIVGLWIVMLSDSKDGAVENVVRSIRRYELL